MSYFTVSNEQASPTDPERLRHPANQTMEPRRDSLLEEGTRNNNNNNNFGGFGGWLTASATTPANSISSFRTTTTSASTFGAMQEGQRASSNAGEAPPPPPSKEWLIARQATAEGRESARTGARGYTTAGGGGGGAAAVAQLVEVAPVLGMFGITSTPRHSSTLEEGSRAKGTASYHNLSSSSNMNNLKESDVIKKLSDGGPLLTVTVPSRRRREEMNNNSEVETVTHLHNNEDDKNKKKKRLREDDSDDRVAKKPPAAEAPLLPSSSSLSMIRPAAAPTTGRVMGNGDDAVGSRTYEYIVPSSAAVSTKVTPNNSNPPPPPSSMTLSSPLSHRPQYHHHHITTTTTAPPHTSSIVPSTSSDGPLGSTSSGGGGYRSYTTNPSVVRSTGNAPPQARTGTDTASFVTSKEPSSTAEVARAAADAAVAATGPIQPRPLQKSYAVWTTQNSVGGGGGVPPTPPSPLLPPTAAAASLQSLRIDDRLRVSEMVVSNIHKNNHLHNHMIGSHLLGTQQLLSQPIQTYNEWDSSFHHATATNNNHSNSNSGAAVGALSSSPSGSHHVSRLQFNGGGGSSSPITTSRLYPAVSPVGGAGSGLNNPHSGNGVGGGSNSSSGRNFPSTAATAEVPLSIQSAQHQHQQQQISNQPSAAFVHAMQTAANVFGSHITQYALDPHKPENVPAREGRPPTTTRGGRRGAAGLTESERIFARADATVRTHSTTRAQKPPLSDPRGRHVGQPSSSLNVAEDASAAPQPSSRTYSHSQLLPASSSSSSDPLLTSRRTYVSTSRSHAEDDADVGMGLQSDPHRHPHRHQDGRSKRYDLSRAQEKEGENPLSSRGEAEREERNYRAPTSRRYATATSGSSSSGHHPHEAERQHDSHHPFTGITQAQHSQQQPNHDKKKYVAVSRPNGALAPAVSHSTYTAPAASSGAMINEDASPKGPRRNETLDALRYQRCFLVMDTCSLLELNPPEEKLNQIIDKHYVRISYAVIHELDKMSKGQAIAAAGPSSGGVGTSTQQQHHHHHHHRNRMDETKKYRCRLVRNWLTEKLTEQAEERSALSVTRYSPVELQRRDQVHQPFQDTVMNNDDSVLGYAIFLRENGKKPSAARGGSGEYPPQLLVSEDLMLRLKAVGEKIGAVSVEDVLSQL